MTRPPCPQPVTGRSIAACHPSRQIAQRASSMPGRIVTTVNVAPIMAASAHRGCRCHSMTISPAPRARIAPRLWLSARERRLAAAAIRCGNRTFGATLAAAKKNISTAYAPRKLGLANGPRARGSHHICTTATAAMATERASAAVRTQRQARGPSARQMKNHPVSSARPPHWCPGPVRSAKALAATKARKAGAIIGGSV